MITDNDHNETKLNPNDLQSSTSAVEIQINKNDRTNNAHNGSKKRSSASIVGNEVTTDSNNRNPPKLPSNSLPNTSSGVNNHGDHNQDLYTITRTGITKFNLRKIPKIRKKVVIIGCKSTFYRAKKKSENIKFFRFPKDNKICNLWLKNSGRQDLMKFDTCKLYKSYRICSLHFGNDMYLGPDKTRLLSQAVPSVYIQPLLDRSTSSTPALEPPQKIKILQNIHVSIPVTDPTLESFESSPMSPLRTQTIKGLSTDTSPSMSPMGTQTSKKLYTDTPRKRKLSLVIKDLQEENIFLKKRIQELEENTIKPPLDINLWKNMCDKFLTPEMSKFIKIQGEQSTKNSHGHRYSNEFKKFALSLYFLGHKCYRYLRRSFVLPSKRVLERYAAKVRLVEGVNPISFEILKIKVNTMSENDKICALCVDEMNLKFNLFYNFGNDEVVGLESDGKIRINKPAHCVTTIMA
ncbi:uncharacterized protein [Onthophagus taurus]|uniref:uncharacterized protein n=1 Tax=Onthophagus taurus TaxID=166361 RepID=UPI0039BDCD8D